MLAPNLLEGGKLRVIKMTEINTGDGSAELRG